MWICLWKWSRRINNKLDKQVVIYPANFADEQHWAAWWIVRELRDDQKTYHACLYLDSFEGVIAQKEIDNIYRFLKFTGDSMRMEFIRIKVPQQENDFDWGLYVLRFIECIAQNPHLAVKAAYNEDISKELDKIKTSREDILQIIQKWRIFNTQ